MVKVLDRTHMTPVSNDTKKEVLENKLIKDSNENNPHNGNL